MLELVDIKKNYLSGDNEVQALKGISLKFRENEFVSILGHSGCGKTTLLNIIGGLDQYTSGDLIINGRSTKLFDDHDWDTYRNHSIGFIFQSYNLIPHQTVLSNVELALTLSGVSKEERKAKAIEVLKKVGLGDQIYKKPNQMSGGQMQRVAIARALVNDPDILLADEPTGALDTETSVQIMELLKEVAKDKLVIMVTHNPELADKYSSRIIRLLDGKITDDTMPVTDDEIIADREDKLETAKTSMSFFTALSLSFNNLMTKKARTILTAFAGSIGIIGIALILSLSNGIDKYIEKVEEETLSSYPISIDKEVVDMSSVIELMMNVDEDPGHDNDKIYCRSVMSQAIKTLMSDSKENNMVDFKKFLDESEDIKEVTNAVQYSYSVTPIIYLNSDTTTLQVNPFDASGAQDNNSQQQSSQSNSQSNMMSSFMTTTWTEMIDNQELLDSQFELVSGEWPDAANEVVLVVDQYNQVSDLTLYALGLKDAHEIYEYMIKMLGNLGDENIADSLDSDDLTFEYDEILGLSYKLVLPTDLYKYDEATNTYTNMKKDKAFVSTVLPDSFTINIVGIIKIKDDAVMTTMQGGSIAYTSALTEYYIEQIQQSEIVKKQLANPDIDVITNLPFDKGDDLTFTEEEKADLFKDYALNLSAPEKSSLFYQIYNAPSDEELEVMAEEFLINYPDRASRQEFLIETIITMLQKFRNGEVDASTLEVTGMNEEALTQFLAMDDATIKATMESMYGTMTDDEMNAMFEEGILVSLKSMYTQNLAASFDTYTNEEIAAMCDTYINTLTTEELAVLFNKHMPPMVSSSSLEINKSRLGLCEIENPDRISIFAKSFEDKEELLRILDNYNDDKEEKDQITYTDYVGLMMSSVTKIVNIISYVLIAFVSISLVVSSIMIGIITYISVLERTKEIGILRAIGASKKDIRRVFNAEAITIGFTAGFMGILITLLLNIPINIIITALTDVSGIAKLPLVGGIALIVLSMFLTFIAGLFPSNLAAKKDPVLALRSE